VTTPLRKDFAGRLAVVTGGAGGIGAEVSRMLAARGADVIVADLDRDRAEVVAQSVGGQAHTMDVRDRDQVAELFDAQDRPPAVLVTCAGGASRRAALDVDEALFQAAIDLNAGGFWRCTQEAARRSIAARMPLSVVHIGSSLYRGPAPELSHFSAAKAASIALVRCLAQELANDRVRVNAVIPGPIETAATTPIWDTKPGLRDALTGKLPLARIGQPGDVAPAVLWLASDEAAWVTGAVLNVDGGLDVAP
jgi:NAD(P)-dependent dehydrogenase (short-subunit alcohol dehydrogenase family)